MLVGRQSGLRGLGDGGNEVELAADLCEVVVGVAPDVCHQFGEGSVSLPPPSPSSSIAYECADEVLNSPPLLGTITLCFEDVATLR